MCNHDSNKSETTMRAYWCCAANEVKTFLQVDFSFVSPIWFHSYWSKSCNGNYGDPILYLYHTVQWPSWLYTPVVLFISSCIDSELGTSIFGVLNKPGRQCHYFFQLVWLCAISPFKHWQPYESNLFTGLIGPPIFKFSVSINSPNTKDPNKEEEDFQEISVPGHFTSWLQNYCWKRVLHIFSLDSSLSTLFFSQRSQWLW